jgi:similar to stage IV sporulation protein
MREMAKIDLRKYNRGTIKIEIQSLIPEKFINLLWKNNVYIKNVTKVNITTLIMDINLSDYRKIEEIGKKTDTKIKIVGRKGLSFFIIRLRRQFTLWGGVVIFIFGLYFLSNFIWNIEITTDKTLTPYEIRQKLFSYGIRPGIAKKKVNVYSLEDKMTKDNDDIMWFRARIEGAKLKITVVESMKPPMIANSVDQGNVVAKMDGEVVRIYTTAGTAVVKPGDIVKASQVLIKGEQGKDGSTYSVHAQGNVIAKTFYEHFREKEVKGVKNVRTGQKIENTYIVVMKHKIYLKKSLNKFTSYDKIEDNSKIFGKEIYFETKPQEFSLEVQKVVKDTVDEMYTSTLQNLDKSAKIIDKIQEVEQLPNSVRIRVVFIVEQNIGTEQTLQ